MQQAKGTCSLSEQYCCYAAAGTSSQSEEFFCLAKGTYNFLIKK